MGELTGRSRLLFPGTMPLLHSADMASRPVEAAPFGVDPQWTAGVGGQLVANRGPGLLVDQRRVLSQEKLALMSNLPGVDVIRRSCSAVRSGHACSDNSTPAPGIVPGWHVIRHYVLAAQTVAA